MDCFLQIISSNWCLVPGTCIFCLERPSQLPAKGYCETCEAAGVPNNSSALPKCSNCGNRHIELSAKNDG